MYCCVATVFIVLCCFAVLCGTVSVEKLFCFNMYLYVADMTMKTLWLPCQASSISILHLVLQRQGLTIIAINDCFVTQTFFETKLFMHFLTLVRVVAGTVVVALVVVAVVVEAVTVVTGEKSNNIICDLIKNNLHSQSLHTILNRTLINARAERIDLGNRYR